MFYMNAHNARLRRISSFFPWGAEALSGERNKSDHTTKNAAIFALTRHASWLI